MAEPRPTTGWRVRLEHFATLAVIVALIAWAWDGTEFDPAQLGDSLPRLAEFFGRMVPPDLTVAETVALSTIETLQIALLGTAFSAVASLALGLLGAANLTPPWVHQPVKWLLGVLRGIPLLLLAAGGVSVLLMPVALAVSRLLERRADSFALDLTRNPAAFATAMRRLGTQNMAEERPSRLVRWLFYSHPPLEERIEQAAHWREGAGR